MVESKYSGYESYSYLRVGADYPPFELDVEIGRVPGHELGLGPAEHERAERLLAESIVISLHDHPAVFPKDMSRVRDYIRTAREHTGFRGLAASGMTAVFDNLMDGTAGVTSKFGWKWDDIIYDLGMRLSDLAHQDLVVVARSVADILAAHDQGRLALVLGLEAATPIENEVDRIDVLYGFGVRQMGIAYSESNTLGSGLKEPGDGGLTLFGRRAVERMNRIGMAIDVSHSSDRTCLDTFEASAKPVLITHAGARAVWDSPRMKPDEVLIGCAQSGGVIGIEAAPHTTLTKRHRAHSIESVMEHFEYCANLMGLDHVTFGPDTLFGDHVGLHREFSDNLGIAAQIEHGPRFDHVAYVDGLENPSENYHNIVGWLVKHGYSDGDIQTVIGGNRHANAARPDPRVRRAAHRAGTATGARADRHRSGHGHHRALRGAGGIRRRAWPRGHHADGRPPRRPGRSGGLRLGAPRPGRRGQRRRRGHLRDPAGLAGSGERDPRPGVADAGFPRPRPGAAGDPTRSIGGRRHGCRGRAPRDRGLARAPLIDPVPMHGGVRRAIIESADALGLSRMDLPSRAGHDSQNMAILGPTGMIFVPSRGGRSHVADEYTSFDAIAAGADVLLATLLDLARGDRP